MRSKFYIGAYGSEKNICALHDSLKLPYSAIKPLKCKPPSDFAEQGVQWTWHSPHHECSSDFPEDELMLYLSNNLGLLQQLKAYRYTLYDLVVIIACDIQDGEKPRGYSISSDLMKLLSDTSATLEIDIT